VGNVLDAVASGALGAVEVAFVLVNRAAGESAVTDESVALLERRGVRVVRASAVAFEREARRAARTASAGGDDAPLWAWRDRFYASYRERLPATDLDLLLGDMWIWGAAQCAERRGVNLHPSLPSGPLGKMWFDVVWDLIESGASSSGVMLHRVTPEVDRGPIVSWCRYPLRTPELAQLWAQLPAAGDARHALVADERVRRRESGHPLFHAVRAAGFARETPLMLQTVRAVAEGQLRLAEGRVLDGRGETLTEGLDLSEQVERMVMRGTA
jgi:phosphoribosylglycinamide formyltransferase-1